MGYAHCEWWMKKERSNTLKYKMFAFQETMIVAFMLESMAKS